jgi:hypothetical protein
MATSRPEAYIRIVDQPSSVYRFRTHREDRWTPIFAEETDQQRDNDVATTRGGQRARRRNQNSRNCAKIKVLKNFIL